MSVRNRIVFIKAEVEFQNVISTALKDIFELTFCKTAAEAVQLQSFEKIDLVVSDYPKTDADQENLKNCLAKNKATAVIILLPASEIKENLKPLNIGSVKVVEINHPHSVLEIKDSIAEILFPELTKNLHKLNSEDFSKVNIKELITKSTLEFDLYVKLSDNKFVKVGHKGAHFPGEQVRQYSAKGIKFLYILKEDFKKYVNYALFLAQKITTQKEVSPEKKMALMTQVGKVILEKVYSEGIDKDNLSEVTEFVMLTIGTMTDAKEVYDLINLLKSSHEDVYVHSIGAAMYSVLMAKEMKFFSTLTSYKLCMAAVFHDVGKKELANEILNKPRHLLDNAEIKIYENHVIKSQQILSSMRAISSDIIQIVSEHHEDMVGRGYPNAMKARAIHPLSKILQVADIFLEYIEKNKKDTKDIKVDQIILSIEKDYQNRIDKDCFLALRRVFDLK